MQCNAMQYNAIQCNTIQYNTMQCNAIQCNTMQCNNMLRGSNPSVWIKSSVIFLFFFKKVSNRNLYFRIGFFRTRNLSLMEIWGMYGWTDVRNEYFTLAKISKYQYKCNAMQCNTMQYNAIQYNTMQCNAITYSPSVRTKISQSVFSFSFF
jgi:hypothetical protein